MLKALEILKFFIESLVRVLLTDHASNSNNNDSIVLLMNKKVSSNTLFAVNFRQQFGEFKADFIFKTKDLFCFGGKFEFSKFVLENPLTTTTSLPLFSKTRPSVLIDNLIFRNDIVPALVPARVKCYESSRSY